MAKKKKRLPHEQFLMLTRYVYDSDEFQALPAFSKVLLFALIRQHNGKNNGSIYASQSHIRQAIGSGSPTTAIKALRCLVECGLVIVTFAGAVNRSRRVALRFLPPGTQMDHGTEVKRWEIWRPGLHFAWQARPVKKRNKPLGRPTQRMSHAPDSERLH